jgi:ParB-like chromosome segregation protein Spo0J
MRAGIDGQLLSPDHSGSVVEFRHALTRDAIFEQLLPLERIETARQLLAALELDRPDVAESFGEQAAALAELAGDRERAADLLLSVARRAQRRGALAAAAPLLLRAWSYVDEAGQKWLEIGGSGATSTPTSAATANGGSRIACAFTMATRARRCRIPWGSTSPSSARDPSTVRRTSDPSGPDSTPCQR